MELNQFKMEFNGLSFLLGFFSYSITIYVLIRVFKFKFVAKKHMEECWNLGATYGDTVLDCSKENFEKYYENFDTLNFD